MYCINKKIKIFKLITNNCESKSTSCICYFIMKGAILLCRTVTMKYVNPLTCNSDSLIFELKLIISKDIIPLIIKYFLEGIHAAMSPNKYICSSKIFRISPHHYS